MNIAIHNSVKQNSLKKNIYLIFQQNEIVLNKYCEKRGMYTYTLSKNLYKRKTERTTIEYRPFETESTTSANFDRI